jgi:hypothetical protein
MFGSFCHLNVQFRFGQCIAAPFSIVQILYGQQMVIAFDCPIRLETLLPVDNQQWDRPH